MNISSAKAAGSADRKAITQPSVQTITLDELFEEVADGENAMTEEERQEFETFPVGEESL